MVLSDWILGASSATNKVYAALIPPRNGDWLRVLRHVQVRRFISRRYLVGR